MVLKERNPSLGSVAIYAGLPKMGRCADLDVFRSQAAGGGVHGNVDSALGSIRLSDIRAGWSRHVIELNDVSGRMWKFQFDSSDTYGGWKDAFGANVRHRIGNTKREGDSAAVRDAAGRPQWIP